MNSRLHSLGPHLRCLVGFLAIASASATVASAQIRLDERANFQNSAFVQTSELIDALFFDAELSVESRDVREAVRLLEQILATEPQSLVRQGNRTYVTAATRVEGMIRSLGEEAWGRYQKGASERAVRAFEQAKMRQKSEFLWSLVRSYPGLSQSAEALQLIGDRAFDEGRFAAASNAYSRLLRRADVDDSERTIVAARLSMARAARGIQAPLAGAGSSVELGGVSIPWDQLQSQLRVEATKRDPGWNTLLGTSTRLRSESHRLEGMVDFAGGRTRLGDLVKTLDDRRATFTSVRERDAFFPPTPLVYKNLAIFAGADCLRFVDLVTGEAPFGPIRYDRDLFVDARTAALDESSIQVSMDGSILYLCFNVSPPRRMTRKGEGYLFALDLERDAFPLWRLEGKAVGGQFPSADDREPFAFSGPAISLDGKVYLGGSRLIEDRTEQVLLQVERDGSVSRSTKLCSGTAVMRFGVRFARSEAKRVDLSPMAEKDGVLYILSNLGVVLAVSAVTGDIDWAFLYNRLFPLESQEYQPETVFGDSGWPTTPVMVTDDRIVVAPNDSRYLYCLAHQPSPEGISHRRGSGRKNDLRETGLCPQRRPPFRG